MRVWLIAVGEPLPIDGKDKRLLRTGILANLLARSGHQVVWWTSTFDHMLKQQRVSRDATIEIYKNYKIKLMHAVEYANNVSLMRLINHRELGKKFSGLAMVEPEPDVILCSLPTLELSIAATRYGLQKGIPVVLDVRDLWPDIFLELVSKQLRWPARILLNPLFKMTSQACSDATAITGITRAFVDWGLRYAKRAPTTLDREFPLGYSQTTPSQEAINKAERSWARCGVHKDSSNFVVCFFGYLGRQFDIKTVIEAARKLQRPGSPFRFVLCGTGDNLELYKKLARDCANIIFPGHVDKADIWTLMQMSSVGVAPYFSTSSFTMSLPNKSIEYLSAGLPVVSSLKGSLEELLQTHNCGVTYKNGAAGALTDSLLYLYDNPEELAAMSKNALSLYKEQFVAEKIYGDMIKYLELVKGL